MKIIDSQSCEIEGKSMTFFQHPLNLFSRIERTLSEIGAAKFFSDPSEKIKRVRESMAEYFFAIALKKKFGNDWWVMQPNSEFPDFIIMSVDDGPNKINIEHFELVEIMNRCQSFEEMMSIVDAKIKKGYPENYNLLIFINHEKSKDWIPLLYKKLEKIHPFKAIWTVHLLYQGEDNPFCSIVNRIRPHPVIHVEANFTDSFLYELKSLPPFIEMIKDGDNSILTFNKEFIKNFIKKIKIDRLKTIKQTRIRS